MQWKKLFLIQFALALIQCNNYLTRKSAAGKVHNKVKEDVFMSKLMQIIVAHQIRKNFGSGDKKRDAGQTTPDNVIRFDNIFYGNIDGAGDTKCSSRFKKWQLLDVYRPKEEAGEAASGACDKLKKLPVIVNLHGGAWVYGDKEVYQFYCMRLAQRGFALVNFSYRLAPEVKFPAALEDTDKVFKWIAANSEKYGFDCDRVFAVGDSAGAHLLALYASGFMKKSDLPLRGIALNCGKYDMSDGLEKDKQTQLILQALLPKGGTKEELELINAAAHVGKDFPPCFVMTCLGDFLYSQAPVIIKALEAAGVPYEYHCYGTKEKPLWHVFHCDPKLPEAVLCNDDECNFFRKLM